MNRRIAVSLLFIAIASTSCGGAAGPADGSLDGDVQTVTEFSQEEFGNVKDLSKASDVVVSGRVGDLAAKTIDTGGNDDPNAGVPMLYYNFSVTKVISGKNVPSSIVICWLDGEALGVEDLSTFSTGQNVILFLDRLPSRNTAAVPKVQDGERYTVLSGDNGVLDVDGEVAVARSVYLTQLDSSKPKSSTKLHARVEDIELAVSQAK